MVVKFDNYLSLILRYIYKSSFIEAKREWTVACNQMIGARGSVLLVGTKARMRQTILL